MAGDSVGLTIIKRKKVIVGGGHHGGAWKVAYADFVTAMMAFFLLMWLLNATTEKQRKGIADYFSPTIPISKISGGGSGNFNGSSMFAEDAEAQNGSGATQARPSSEKQASGTTGSMKIDQLEGDANNDANLAAIESLFSGNSGESSIDNELLEHIRTRVTDEGLIIEIFDLENASLFVGESAEPSEKLTALLKMMADAIGMVKNSLAISGHTSSVPIVVRRNPNWELSADRAQRARQMLLEFGVSEMRFERITGKADRNLAVDNPMAARNRRIEITLLRSNRPKE